MHPDRILYLIARKKSGDIKLEEQLELAALMKSDAQAASLIKELDEVLDSPLAYKTFPKADDISQALDQLHEKMHEKKAPVRLFRYRRRRLIWAASIALLISLGLFLFWPSNSGKAEAENIVTTRKGSRTDLVLPDGTRVWVNADTRLSYDKNFGNQTREVHLTGEAYFDVTRDESRPFIVHTNKMDVKVLGTAFNVRAYTNESSTQTTLLRGSVEIQLKGEDRKKIRLSPNEKLILHQRGASSGYPVKSGPQPDIELLKIAAPEANTATNEIQWTQNRLVFDQETFGNIIPVIERWYNVSIQVDSTVQLDRLLKVKFENDSLEDVLDALKEVVGFQYSILKDKVIIY